MTTNQNQCCKSCIGNDFLTGEIFCANSDCPCHTTAERTGDRGLVFNKDQPVTDSNQLNSSLKKWEIRALAAEKTAKEAYELGRKEALDGQSIETAVYNDIFAKGRIAALSELVMAKDKFDAAIQKARTDAIEEESAKCWEHEKQARANAIAEAVEVAEGMKKKPTHAEECLSADGHNDAYCDCSEYTAGFGFNDALSELITKICTLS